ncbi:MAG: hypothetical protein JHD28_00810 [Bacteroidia bacterium]|nr:hypothetical protein [Bacteroidia bacterium]
MIAKSKILTLKVLLIIVISVISYMTLYYCKDYQSEIKERYEYDLTSTSESYNEDCAFEFKNNIQFPIDKPIFAKLHFDQFFKPPKTLNKSQTETILKILNYTSSYIWGELGTPYFDRRFTFYDKDRNCIGYTEFSFDGQTYSTPRLAKMKWGLLTEKARVILLKTINSLEE